MVILDSRNTERSAPVERSLAQGLVGDDAGAVPEDPSVGEASLALVKEKFRLLTLQTLKFSRLWLIVQVTSVARRAISPFPYHPWYRLFSILFIVVCIMRCIPQHKCLYLNLTYLNDNHIDAALTQSSCLFFINNLLAGVTSPTASIYRRDNRL